MPSDAQMPDARRWDYYPIEMPLTADGKGPATVGVDAARIAYEVWDRDLSSHASYDNLPDAINEAMRLNAALPSDPAVDLCASGQQVRAVIDAADRDADRCAERIAELERLLEKARAEAKRMDLARDQFLGERNMLAEALREIQRGDMTGMMELTEAEAAKARATWAIKRIGTPIAALTPASQPEGQSHRSFPDAADGRPMPPMGEDLMAAGLSGEDARFVALQLAQNGLMLVPATPTAQEAVPVWKSVERKFYRSEWPLAKLLEARNGGLVTDEGEAWVYRYTHKDGVGGEYDMLVRRELVSHTPQPSETVAEAVGARLATREELLADEILAELTRARTKFPGKNVTFAALVEEVGELATAVFEEGADRVRKEAVQVAVMAMRMILDGDHCYEPWRAEKGLDPLDPALRALKGDGE